MRSLPIVFAMLLVVLCGCGLDSPDVPPVTYLSAAQEQQVLDRNDPAIEALQASGYTPLATVRNDDDAPRLLFTTCPNDRGDQKCFETGPSAEKPWVYIALEAAPNSPSESGEKFTLASPFSFRAGIPSKNANNRVFCTPENFEPSSGAFANLAAVFKAEPFREINPTDRAVQGSVSGVNWSCDFYAHQVA